MSLDEGSQRNNFQPMYFVSRIKGTRDTHVLTAEEFRKKAEVSRLALAAGKPMTNFTLQERFTGGLVRPYYDWDAKHEEMPDDLEFEEKFHLREFKGVMAKLHPGARVSYAQRHGRLDVGGEYVYKISYRAFVIGLKMNVEDIPTHIRTVLGLDARAIHKHLDLSVYKSREQLVGCIYATKDTDKVKRFLVPLDPTEDVCNFLAQAVAEKDQFVDVGRSSSAPAGSGTAEKRKRGRPRKNAVSVSVPPVRGNVLIRGSDCKEAAEAATEVFGDRFRLHESFKTFAVDHDARVLRLDTEEKWCFIRKAKHQSNNQYINIDPERGAVFRCHDDDCKAAVKGRSDLTVPWNELPQAIKDLHERTFPAPTEGDIGDELLHEATAECQSNIVVNWPKEEGLDIRRVQEMLTAPAKAERCLNCNELIHWQHSARGLRKLCSECGLDWPVGSYLPTPIERYPKLAQALMLLQVNVQNNISNVTVNNYQVVADQEFYTDFSGDDIKMFDDAKENGLFIGSLQGTDSMLARFTTYHFRDKYHCTSSKQWYVYVGHRWSEDAADLAYKEDMASDAFLQPYHQVALMYENYPVQTEDIKKKARLVRKLCKALEDGHLRDRIVTDSIQKFHEKRPLFAATLNTQNVLVFDDGVFHFDDLSFRPGTPDMAVTMHVPQPFVTFDAENEHVKFLFSFLSDILPDPDVREYTLKILGLTLTTDTSQQYFWIFTGSGGNGKGKLMTLMEECLGDYYQAVSPAMLTRRREDANQANEALMSLRMARLAVFQEPEKREVIQASQVKSLTGQDTLSTRGNYGKQMKWKPTFKCIFITNAIPTVSESSLALWRRVRIIDFETSFVDDPTEPHEKKIDHDLDSKLKAAAPHFIPILLEYYGRYKRDGLKEPEPVQKATRTYKASIAAVKDFVEKEMVKEPGCWVRWKDLAAAYAKWSGGHCFDKGTMDAELAKCGIKHVRTQRKVPGHAKPYVDINGYDGWRLLSSSPSEE